MNFPGTYTFSATENIDGAPGYVTLTDALNNVIAHGLSPLHVAIPGTGQYRAHWTNEAACNSSLNCYTTTAGIHQCPGVYPATRDYRYGYYDHLGKHQLDGFPIKPCQWL